MPSTSPASNRFPLTSLNSLNTAPELRDNKKLRINKCKAGVWNVGFSYAGADAGKHTAHLQTQKRVNDAQPQPRLCAVFARLVSTHLKILLLKEGTARRFMDIVLGVSTLLEILHGVRPDRNDAAGHDIVSTLLEILPDCVRDAPQGKWWV